VPSNRSWFPLSENPNHHPQKTNRSDKRCIWRYSFQAWVWNCQILNQVVESQLFTSLWNRYHQWLSDIELIQISVFSASYSRINPCFTAGKRIGVWNCHATSRHRKTSIFSSIVFYFLDPLTRRDSILTTSSADDDKPTLGFAESVAKAGEWVLARICCWAGPKWGELDSAPGVGRGGSDLGPIPSSSTVVVVDTPSSLFVTSEFSLPLISGDD
jgi:hypothetical protein